MKEKNLLEILKNSRYTVILSGIELMIESGYPALRDGEESYDIEEKYGYSFEEIFSSGFYAVRKELFFRFYKEEMIRYLDIPPGEGFQAMKKLQDYGLVKSVITRRVAGLEERVGMKNVLNLHGSMNDNVCPNCGKKYPMEFLRDAQGVPLCTKCLVPIRPKVTLFGEMIDNGVITKAAAEVERADVLLVLGTSLHSPLCNQLLQYYRGNSLILVTEKERFSDHQADVIVHERCTDFLTGILEEYERQERIG